MRRCTRTVPYSPAISRLSSSTAAAVGARICIPRAQPDARVARRGACGVRRPGARRGQLRSAGRRWRRPPLRGGPAAGCQRAPAAPAPSPTAGSDRRHANTAHAVGATVSDRRSRSGEFPAVFTRAGLRPAAISACVAQAVDCALERPSELRVKPPSLTCLLRKNCTARLVIGEPLRPAATSAWITAAVSSTPPLPFPE